MIDIIEFMLGQIQKYIRGGLNDTAHKDLTTLPAVD